MANLVLVLDQGRIVERGSGLEKRLADLSSRTIMRMISRKALAGCGQEPNGKSQLS